jgi:hypothetical protein
MPKHACTRHPGRVRGHIRDRHTRNAAFFKIPCLHRFALQCARDNDAAVCLTQQLADRRVDAVERQWIHAVFHDLLHEL